MVMPIILDLLTARAKLVLSAELKFWINNKTFPINSTVELYRFIRGGDGNNFL